MRPVRGQHALIHTYRVVAHQVHPDNPAHNTVLLVKPDEVPRGRGWSAIRGH